MPYAGFVAGLLALTGLTVLAAPDARVADDRGSVDGTLPAHLTVKRLCAPNAVPARWDL